MTNFEIALHHLKRILDLPDDHLLKKHFLEDISYRYDLKNKRLAGIKEWRIIQKRANKKFLVQPETQTIVLSSSPLNEQFVYEYVQGNVSDQKLQIIHRDQITYRFKSLPENLKFLWLAFKISLICIIRSKNRLNLALCIREVIEWAGLLELLRDNNIKKFIDFSSYEKDSNAIAQLLIENQIHVTKIPSSGPLHAHYKFVISDSIVLSSAYQKEEIPSLSKNWIFENVLFWPPEKHHLYKNIYTHCDEPKSKTIGFYSHGEWLRRMEGHADPGLDILENEEALLSDLSQFLQRHKDYELIIFPHPKERKSEHTQGYYQQKLSGVSFSFSPEGTPSAHLFHSVDIGLMAYSTLIFERIGMGYKTFIAKYTSSTFPVEGSALNALLFNNADTLEKQLLATENEFRSKYFERNNLSNHLISNFTNQL